MGKEYVILGNDALMKCSVPSFVADNVDVTSWHANDGLEMSPNQVYGKDPIHHD